MHAAVHGHVQQGRSNVDSDAVPDATLQSLLDSIMNGSLQAVHSTAAAMATVADASPLSIARLSSSGDPELSPDGSGCVDVNAIAWPQAVPVQHPALVFDIAGAMHPEGPLGDTPLSHVSFATPVAGANAVSFVAATEFSDMTFQNHINDVPNAVSVGSLDLGARACWMPSTDPAHALIIPDQRLGDVRNHHMQALRHTVPGRSVCTRWLPGGTAFVTAVGHHLMLFAWPVGLQEARGCHVKAEDKHLHSEPVRDLAVNADRILLSGGHDGRVCFTDLAAAPDIARMVGLGGLGRALRRHVVAGVVGSVAWRHASCTASITTDDGLFAVMDPRDPRLVVQSYMAGRTHGAAVARLYAHAGLDTNPAVALGYDDGYIETIDLRAHGSSGGWWDPVVASIGQLEYNAETRLLCATGKAGMSMTNVWGGQASIHSAARGPLASHEYVCTGQWIGAEPVFALSDSMGRLAIFTPQNSSNV